MNVPQFSAGSRGPPGTYSVAAWHEGDTRDNRSVTIPSQGGPVDLDCDIP